MDTVTVINRTSKPLEALWDGHRHKIPVGESLQPWLVAQAAQKQNVLMGSADPNENYSDFGTMISLVAIREQDDDESPIEQSTKIERWDRRYMPGGEQAIRVVQGRIGYGSVQTSPQSSGVSFAQNEASGKIPDIPVR
jgi:hypothetical protein